MQSTDTNAQALRLESAPWQRAGISKAYAYQLMSRGLFPAAVKIGRASRFVVEEVDDWIAARIGERDAAQVSKAAA